MQLLLPLLSPLFSPPSYEQAESLAPCCVHLLSRHRIWCLKSARDPALSAYCLPQLQPWSICTHIFFFPRSLDPYFSIPILHCDKYLTLSWDNNSPSSDAGVNGERWGSEMNRNGQGKGCSSLHYLWVMAPICISISFFGEPTTLVTLPSQRSLPG